MSDDRLSSKTWVDAGLAALAQAGPTGLKADTLAKTLRVSRGSFYWHFADVRAFHTAVLHRWREVAMVQIIAEVDGEAGDRMKALLRRVLRAERRLEIAVRSWAMTDEMVRRAVAAVDTERLAYVRRLLVDAGLPGDLAETRARILYWVYLGYALSGEKLEPEALQRLLDGLDALTKP